LAGRQADHRKGFCPLTGMDGVAETQKSISIANVMLPQLLKLTKSSSKLLKAGSRFMARNTLQSTILTAKHNLGVELQEPYGSCSHAES